MKEAITLKKVVGLDELTEGMRSVTFRGLYNKDGERLEPYRNARFSLATISPPSSIGSCPTLSRNDDSVDLFTPQPTIYQNQTDITETVDHFLKTHGHAVASLEGAIEYDWEGRGTFHVLPPVIERHDYDLRDGYFDLKRLTKRLKNTYVKDACGNLHHLGDRHLHNFYIDEVSKFDRLDVFHSNAPLINYGLTRSGRSTFYIICDGAHRVDYVIEKQCIPMNALVVEPEEGHDLIPYYAFPVPFRPTLRLSSKKSEKMFHRLERDKIHLLNDYIKKALHYDWEVANLKVSKLRSNVEIY